MSKTKNASTKKMTSKQKKQAQLEANRRARMQWYILGAIATIIVIAIIVLIVLNTDGQVPLRSAPNG